MLEKKITFGNDGMFDTIEKTMDDHLCTHSHLGKPSRRAWRTQETFSSLLHEPFVPSFSGHFEIKYPQTDVTLYGLLKRFVATSTNKPVA
jgi:hypothetical protein